MGGEGEDSIYNSGNYAYVDGGKGNDTILGGGKIDAGAGANYVSVNGWGTNIKTDDGNN